MVRDVQKARLIGFETPFFDVSGGDSNLRRHNVHGLEPKTIAGTSLLRNAKKREGSNQPQCSSSGNITLCRKYDVVVRAGSSI